MASKHSSPRTAVRCSRLQRLKNLIRGVARPCTLKAQSPDKLPRVIVRDKPDSYVLIAQHDHGRISGQFARHWRERPTPLEPTLYAIANHDVAWQKLDKIVHWDETTGRPYSFADYPLEPKMEAYRDGLDFLVTQDPYAACLCSMHYASFVRDAESAAERRFREGEDRRQERLKGAMSARELEHLERNFRLLRTCDDLSLFVCLNEPGRSDHPWYTNGFEFMGTRLEPVWEDRRTLRLDPNPLSGAFDLSIPYLSVGKDRRPLGSGRLALRVVTL
jgi:hypothetical protein